MNYLLRGPNSQYCFAREFFQHRLLLEGHIQTTAPSYCYGSCTMSKASGKNALTFRNRQHCYHLHVKHMETEVQ